MPRLTPQELASRKLGLGSTDVVEALGLAPWEGAGPMRLYLAKTTDEPETDRDNEDHLEWGHLQEPIILAWYESKTGAKVIPGGHVPHRDHLWLWASLDGFTPDRNVEIKNVASNMASHWDSYAEDGIPRYVRAQVTIGMACSGKRLCDVVASVGGRPPHVWTVEYDEELASLLIDGACRFWQNTVDRISPPLDATPATKEYLRRTYPSNVDRVIVDAWEEADVLAEERMVWMSRESAAKREKDIRDAKLMALIGDRDGVNGDTWKMTWKLDKNGVRRSRFTARGEE